MRAYPPELRQRIVEAVDAGTPAEEVAEQFGVCVASVYRYRARQRHLGHLDPTPKPGRPRLIPVGAEAALRAQVEAVPDATLAEHCTQWAATAGYRVHVVTMWRALGRLAFTPKKRCSMPASKTP